NFHSDKLSVYKVDEPSKASMAVDPAQISAKYNWEYKDQVYSKFGNYIEANRSDSLFYPYQGIEERNAKLSVVNIESKKYISTNVSVDVQNYKYITLPAFKLNSEYIFTVNLNRNILSLCQFTPEVLVHGVKLEAKTELCANININGARVVHL